MVMVMLACAKPAKIKSVVERVEDEATLPRGEPSEPYPPAPVEVEDGFPVTQGSALSLRRQDAARAGGFARLVAVLCVAGLLSQLVVGGTVWLRVLFDLSVLALGITAGRVWWVTRHPLDYRPSLARAFGSVAVVMTHPSPSGGTHVRCGRSRHRAGSRCAWPCRPRR